MRLSKYMRCSASFTELRRLSRPIVDALDSTNSRKPSNSSLVSCSRVQPRKNFDKFLFPDVQSCTKMIVGYARDNKLEDALKLFAQMPFRDTVSWNSMIKGCLDCGDLRTARKLFDEMPNRSVVSWTTMVHGFFQFGKVEMAEIFFQLMPERDLASYNAMVHGYCSNGRVEDGLRFFERMPSRNVISWTSMIGGLDQIGKSEEALFLFERMMQSGVILTSSTLACVLTACANASTLLLGLQLHGSIVKLGFCSDEFICASLITFYAHCKQMEKATEVFNTRSLSNVVIWTALVTGFGSNSKHEDALKVFGNMLRVSVLPNESSFASVLNSCCNLEALDRGKEVHALAMKLNVGNDTFVGNSLIVMYSKCGILEDALTLFRRIEQKNTVTWNATISGCSQHGRGMWCLALFAQMMRAGIEVDDFTLTVLLSACSHSGILQTGRSLFRYFSTNTSVELKHEHYACMVDVLGRCGKLEEAEDVVRNMPMKPNSVVWLALLSAGRMHSDFDVAERAANSILVLEPNCGAAYVLLSNLYASANRWSDVARLRVLMKERGIAKQRGCSWVVLKGERHIFLSGDKSHPSSGQIYQKLDWLKGKLKEYGYVPDQSYALHDVEDEQREESLAYHSERLAIAFGLVSTVEGSTIIVMKNLHVCGDCHSVIKLTAKIVGREIIVRDSNRFHHFNNGGCSCGDYW